MVTLVALIIWRFNILIVLFFFLVFGCLDCVYLSSALTKVPTGAWFTLLLAVTLSSIFILWRFGKEQQWGAEAKDRVRPSDLITATPTGDMYLTQSFGGAKVITVGGVGIFFDKVGDMVPIVFAQFVRKFSTRPEIVVFLHMRPLSTPSILESERYVISRTTIPGCYRLTIRHGYSDIILNPDLGRLIVEQLVLYITRGSSLPNGSVTSTDHSPEVQKELDLLERAHAFQTVYVVGKEQMKIQKGTNVIRKALLEAFLWIRENSRTKIADMNIPVGSLVEVGFVKEI
jgi:KUP system potassium uptake protein